VKANDYIIKRHQRYLTESIVQLNTVNADDLKPRKDWQETGCTKRIHETIRST